MAISNSADFESTENGAQGVETFVPLTECRPRGVLPWGVAQIRKLVKDGVLPPPAKFGRRTGYTLSKIRDIQRKHMVGA
jgi:hypothetical protein